MGQVEEKQNFEEMLAADHRALKQEVLKEVCCVTKAKIIKYLESNGIPTGDGNNPMVVIYWELVDIENHIIS